MNSSNLRKALCILAAFVSYPLLTSAQDGARIGYIENQESNIPALLQGLTAHFPVATLEVVTLQNNLADHGVDAVVNEMESTVNDMKSRGIDQILIQTTSRETQPFIDGSQGNLGGVHSDVRHPNVIFSADRQGTAAVDDAQNWYRAGIDFVTDKELGAPLLLPDVSSIEPRPQFILGTDNSSAVDQSNVPFTQQATTAGYDVVLADLGWSDTTFRFDDVAVTRFGETIAAAPPGSKIGLSAAALFDPEGDGSPPLTRWVRLTEQGLADPNVFDPDNENVEYIGLNYQPFLGDFDDPGSITVDIEYGVVTGPALVVDPEGVHPILQELGFPNDPFDAFDHDSVEYNGSGIVMAAAFTWMASNRETSLDPRHLIDENRQLVEYFVEDLTIPAGATWNEPLTRDTRVNPRWEAIVPEPASARLGGWLCLAMLTLRRRHR